MPNFSISFALLLSVVLLSERKLQVEANECTSNSDCGLNKYCCQQMSWYETNVCRSSCVDQACYLDDDCGGPKECCNSKKLCTAFDCVECFEKSDCDLKEYCCKRTNRSDVCVHGGCLDRPCYFDRHCRGPGECCDSTNHICTKSGCNECDFNSDCKYNYYCCKQRYPNQTRVCGYHGCVGKSCNLDSDCGGADECCRNNNCRKLVCFNVAKGLASWIIAVIVVSVLVALVIPIIIIACLWWRPSATRHPQHAATGEAVLNQETRSTLIAQQNTQTVQNNPYPPPGYSKQDLPMENAQVYAT